MDESNKKPRRRFTLEFKSKIILFYDSLQVKEDKREKSINKIGDITGIDRRIISYWLRTRTGILGSDRKRTSFKVKSTNDLSICPLMEINLADWIRQRRDLGFCLTGDVIKKEALKLYDSFHPADPLKRFCA